jgi:hypothetical protein
VFIEALNRMGIEVVVEHAQGELSFPPGQKHPESQIRQAIRLLARPLAPAVRAEARRTLDAEARRMLARTAARDR